YGGIASFRSPYHAAPWLDRRYDVLHCHFGSMGLRGLLLRNVFFRDAKLTVAFHGYDMSSYIQTHGRQVYRGLFREADLLMPVSRRWEQELVKMGWQRERISLHRMGVDCEKFDYVPRLSQKGQTVRVVTVARLV